MHFGMGGDPCNLIVQNGGECEEWSLRAVP